MLSFIRRLLPKPIANSGSELRDHLANERTFLSWTRMGLAFAAMALALGRLSLIDRMVNERWGKGGGGTIIINDNNSTNPSDHNGKLLSSTSDRNKAKAKAAAGIPNSDSAGTGADLVASRVCQGISIWCFGYGLYRYVAVRNHLMRGVFVPGIWGPILMTGGSLGVFATVMHFDWRRSVSDSGPLAVSSIGIGKGEKRE
ncbi:hypothetical protein DTO166G5_8798 [Paecilomyces variotii]|nr:hypothetical protein DTO166G5_8798 [Paecilomyces variotii]